MRTAIALFALLLSGCGEPTEVITADGTLEISVATCATDPVSGELLNPSCRDRGEGPLEVRVQTSLGDPVAGEVVEVESSHPDVGFPREGSGSWADEPVLETSTSITTDARGRASVEVVVESDAPWPSGAVLTLRTDQASAEVQVVLAE